MKTIRNLVIALVVLAVVMKLCRGNEIIESSSDTSISKYDAESYIIDGSASYQLREINKRLKESFNINKFRSTVPSILDEVDVFLYYGRCVTNALKSETDSLKTLATNVKKDLQQIQKSEFPILRRLYVEKIKSDKWKADIYVKCKGNRSEILEYRGTLFASNSTIQSAMEAISDLAHELRYKKVIFKWIEDDPSPVYYTIKSKKDEDIN